MLVNEESFVVGEGKTSVVVEAELEIKVYRFWSWFTRLASIVLV